MSIEDKYDAAGFIARIKALPLVRMAPHPRTVLWMEQRKKCETCIHMYKKDKFRDPDLLPAMYCDLDGYHVFKHNEGYCIDMREPGAKCGPRGRKYEQDPRKQSKR